MYIYGHINGLASTIEFKRNRKKQYRHPRNYNFPLYLPQKTKHNSIETFHAASKWYVINFQWVLGIYLMGGGGDRESTKRLGMLNIPWQGSEKNIYKNWSTCRHGRTAGERFVDWGGYSDWNKRNTITQQPVTCWLVWSIRNEKNKNNIKLTVTYDMAGKRDHLIGDMNPLAGMPSSLVV